MVYHQLVSIIILSNFYTKLKLSIFFKGTNADVYIQIIDHDGNKSEPIQLKESIDHKNKFERDKTDEFDVGMLFFLSRIRIQIKNDTY